MLPTPHAGVFLLNLLCWLVVGHKPAQRARAILWLIIFALVALTFAKGQVSIYPRAPLAGGKLVVEASALPRGSQVTVQFTKPDAETTAQSAQVNNKGGFRIELALAEAGRYQLRVRGAGLQIRRNITVRAAPQAASPAADAAKTARKTAGALADVELVGRTLFGSVRGRIVWQHTFAPQSGATSPPLLRGEELFVGHGNSLLRMSRASGKVQSRYPLSGAVSAVQLRRNGSLDVTVRHKVALREHFTYQNGRIKEGVRFGSDPRMFRWLWLEAQGGDPLKRLEQDPTNPYLYLRAAQHAPKKSQALFDKAIAHCSTFYDAMRLSRHLAARGQLNLAAKAFDKAMQDFAARGYDPNLLTQLKTAAAYNMSLTPLELALDAGNEARARFWAERLYVVSSALPESRSTFLGYANLLDIRGEDDAAALWRQRVAQQSRPANDIGIINAVAAHGWRLALALCVAFAALSLALFAKYLPPLWRRLKAQGKPLWRAAFPLGLAHPAERLTLCALLFTAFISGALATWQAQVQQVPELYGTGTLNNYLARRRLDNLRGPAARVADLEGYFAAVDGDSKRAKQLLRNTQSASGRNNYGVVSGEQAAFGNALRLEPSLLAARYNTGNKTALPFHAAFLPGQPALAAPSFLDVQTAVAGTYQRALLRAFTRPQSFWQSNVPAALPPAVWRTSQTLFALLFFWALAQLLAPYFLARRHRPRKQMTNTGHVLAAGLIPGSLFVGKLWGLLLLLPWAASLTELTARYLGLQNAVGLEPYQLANILLLTYAVNFVALFITITLLGRLSPQTAQEVRQLLARIRRTLNPK